MTVVIAILCVFSATGRTRAAPIELTLETAIELALKDGYEAQVSRLGLVRAEQDQRVAEGRTGTRVNVDFESPDFAKQVQSVRLPDQLPAYNTVGSLLWGGALRITQPIVLTNTTLTLTSDLEQTRQTVFSEQSDGTDKRRDFQTQFRLSLKQPILSPNTLKLNLERANLKLERTRRHFTEAQLDVIYRATEAFYDAVHADRMLAIAREEIERQEAAYQLAETRFQIGAIAEVALLQFETDLAESRNTLILATGDVGRTSDRLKQMIGLPLATEMVPKDDMQVRHFSVDSSKAVSHALRHRSDVRGAEIDRRLAEISLKETDARSAVNAQLTAYYDRTGVSDPFLPYETGTGDLMDSSWEDLRRRPRNVGVRFYVTVPLWDSRTNAAEVASARAALSQRGLAEEDRKTQITREARSAISAVHEANARLVVLEKGLEVARRNYAISRSRFEVGAITALDLSDSQTRLMRARLSHLDAYVSHRLSVASLARTTLYDFEQGRSLVGER